MLLEVLFWAILGSILGSFTNVLILRHGTSSVVRGRSACPACKRQLEWYELFPILSYVLLRGRCRTCTKSISIQYPIVELLVAILFVCIGMAPVALLLRLVGLGIAVLLVAIAVYDLRHTIMPDRWVAPFVGLAFTYGALLADWSSVEGMMYFLLAGPAVAAPLGALWFFSKGAWMGFGDVKFALGIGWLLGFISGYVALMLAFVIGAVVGVCILVPLPRIVRLLRSAGITRLSGEGAGFTMKSEVPFGPFLILSLCIIWFSMLYDVDTTTRLLDFLSLSSWL